MPIGVPAILYRCSICKEYKRRSSFPACARERDGVKNTCKMCQRAIWKSWHARNKKARQEKADTQKNRRKRKKFERTMLDNAERMKLGIMGEGLHMMLPGLMRARIGNSWVEVHRATAKFMKEREPNDPFWDQFLEEEQ